MILFWQGLALLTLQSHYPHLQPPACDIFNPTAHCEKVKGGHATMLFSALYLLAAGSAGIKASMPAHGADQFDERDPKEAAQMSTFFNFLLMAICLGGALSLTLFVWIQENKGWDWAFGLACISIFLALMVFIAGLPKYRIHVAKRTNAIVEIIQVSTNLCGQKNQKIIDLGQCLQTWIKVRSVFSGLCRCNSKQKSSAP